MAEEKETKPEISDKTPTLISRCNEWILVPRNMIITIVLLLLVTAYAIFSSQLDKAFLEEQIAAYNERLAQNPMGECKRGEIQYDDLKVEGGFISRKAIIYSPRLVCVEPVQEFEISTEAIVIEQASWDLSEFDIIIQTPLSISNYNIAFTTISFNEPVFLSVQMGSIDSNSLKYILHIPQRLSLVTDVIDGVEEIDPEMEGTVSIQFATPLIAESSTYNDGKTSTIKLLYEGMQITKSGEPDAISVESFDSLIKHDVTEEDIPYSHYQFNLLNMNVMDGGEQIPPMTIAADLYIENFVGNLTAAELISKSGRVYLKNFDMYTNALNIKAKGEFAKSANQVLPTGDMTLNINDIDIFFDLLRRVDGYTIESEALITAILEKAMGQSLAENKQVNVRIVRDENNPLMVGKATFDEMLGLVLTHSVTEANKPQKNISQ